MPCKNFTFLFAPVDAVGHFNACIGIAGHLRDRAHKVVFATPNDWKGKLEPLGFQEEFYTTKPQEIEPDNGTSKPDTWGALMSKMAPALAMFPEEQAEHLLLPIQTVAIQQVKYSEPMLKEIVGRVKPDAIVVDSIYHSPALMDSGFPYILCASIAPLSISRENVPPPMLGLPTVGDPQVWEVKGKKRDAVFFDLFTEFNKWVVNNGGQELTYHYPFFLNFSPHANIYMYPIELDYTTFRPNPPNWFQFDAFVRETDDKFKIPEKLKNGPGKLIYFSMGTIGSSEIGLMQRLIAILAKSPNRFIVSKGPLGHTYDLADNMWGENSVPQTKVIPLVDLVITHGGNNTVTESFYFGKRVIVLPLFVDQWDNGQRIFETGLGLQFPPYHVTQEELLSAIENLLKDDLLERRMISISKRIQSTNSQARAADVIENVARNNKQ